MAARRGSEKARGPGRWLLAGSESVTTVSEPGISTFKFRVNTAGDGIVMPGPGHSPGRNSQVELPVTRNPVPGPLAASGYPEQRPAALRLQAEGRRRQRRRRQQCQLLPVAQSPPGAGTL